MKILAVGSPKGGVGKSTITVNLADVYRRAGRRVIVIDADENLSSSDWIERSDGAIDVDYDAVDRPRTLRQIAAIPGYDVMLIDLPGSARKSGELRALLYGEDGKPIPDFLLVPTEFTDMDLRVVERVLPDISSVPHRVVLSKVPPRATRAVERGREAYRNAGWQIADTLIRDYTAHVDAVAYARSIISAPGGSHSRQRRAAEHDMRELAREVARYLGIRVRIDPIRDPDPDDQPAPAPTP